jgi:hypothetical protein
MQHERIGIQTQRCNDERHLMCHQAAYEMDVSAESIELGNDHGTLQFLRCCKGALSCGAVRWRRSLCRSHLNKLLGKLQAFSLSELDQGAALCRKAQTGTTRRAVETRM